MWLAKLRLHEINRNARDIPLMLTRHIKQCATCTLAKDNVVARCDLGWALSKAMSRARYAKWKLDQESPADTMDPLFSLDEIEGKP